MPKDAAYMREYRARRKEQGRPCKGGPTPVVYQRRALGRSQGIVDPWDYSHPDSEVRTEP